jgi:ABC-type molybdenum transport system ATPase subunit/photorepair protein PhrA
VTAKSDVSTVKSQQIQTTQQPTHQQKAFEREILMVWNNKEMKANGLRKILGKAELIVEKVEPWHILVCAAR